MQCSPIRASGRRDERRKNLTLRRLAPTIVVIAGSPAGHSLQHVRGSICLLGIPVR